MDILIKRFKDLTIDELYDLLQLRSEVFVVEQNCVYQDIDNKDQKALHVLLKQNNSVIGYTRIFKPGDYFEYASIGRVVIEKKNRHNNLGTLIIKASIQAIKDKLDTETIKISAQTYLYNFYTNLGFKAQGDSYLEDGIPHVAMIRS